MQDPEELTNEVHDPEADLDEASSDDLVAAIEQGEIDPKVAQMLEASHFIPFPWWLRSRTSWNRFIMATGSVQWGKAS